MSTTTPQPDIQTILRSFCRSNDRPVNIAGETFGFLVAEMPVAPNHKKQGIVWRCRCTLCGGTRDLPQGYLRMRVRLARRRNHACILACTACTKRGRPRVENPKKQQTQRSRMATPRVRKPRAPVERATRQSEGPATLKPVVTTFELVADGKVMARSKRTRDLEALRKVFGGEIRPATKSAKPGQPSGAEAQE